MKKYLTIENDLERYPFDIDFEHAKRTFEHYQNDCSIVYMLAYDSEIKFPTEIMRYTGKYYNFIDKAIREMYDNFGTKEYCFSDFNITFQDKGDAQITCNIKSTDNWEKTFTLNRKIEYKQLRSEIAKNLKELIRSYYNDQITKKLEQFEENIILFDRKEHK